jgi:hypothetical protein
MVRCRRRNTTRFQIKSQGCVAPHQALRWLSRSTRARDRKHRMQSQVLRTRFIRYLVRSGRPRLLPSLAYSYPQYRRATTMSAATHPVETSQQSVQLPALDASHAPGTKTDGTTKPKKEKKPATGSAYPLEVRNLQDHVSMYFLTQEAKCRWIRSRSTSHTG